MSTDPDVEGVSLLDWVRLALFLSPLSVGERVENDLSLIEADGDEEWNVVSGEVSGLRVKVDGETLGLMDGGSLDDESLSWLELLLENRAVWDWLKT